MLHWVILLVNDIYDRYHQWPMNVNQFQSYITDKYDDVNAVHHYEISQKSGDTTEKINIASFLFSLLTLSQSINEFSHPSSLILAVNSDVLSAGE